METMSGRLLRAFALALDLPEAWFDDKVDKHRSALRALNYPHPDRWPEGQLRASAHTDYGSLTILRQDGAPGGLQVQAPLGSGGAEWIDVPANPDGFVCNLGDLMRRWTNDRWASTMHRVVMPPPDARGSTRRQSMAYFQNINPHHVVECIPTCLEAGARPLYPPIRSFDFLMKKHAAATSGSKGADWMREETQAA